MKSVKFHGYEVTEDGRVFSHKKQIGFGKWIEDENFKKERKPSKNKWGYLQIGIKINGRYTVYFIHRIVLEAFIGPRPEGFDARHLDGNKENNHISNLVWGSKKENAKDKKLHGIENFGEKNGNSKLTKEQVIEIRQLYDDKYTMKQLAQRFNVSTPHIFDIVHKHVWAWV